MSAFKKSLLVAGVAMILSNNVFADEGHGIVKFKGEVISAPCSIKPGDEDLRKVRISRSFLPKLTR
nr:fimbrial protein [Escherichia coli]